MTDRPVTASESSPAALADMFPPADIAVWRGLVDKALKGGDFEKRLVSRTSDGIRIEPLYLSRPQLDVPLAGLARATADWDIRQLHGGSDPGAQNAAILEDLAGGTSSIKLQIGAPGNGGLPYRERDVAAVLDGVLLDVCPVALKAGEYTPDAAGSLIALWNGRGLSSASRRAAFNYDPIGTLAETGGLYHPMPRSLAVAVDLVRQSLVWPHVTALTADGHIWHAAGASEAQELAGVLATVVAYLRAAEAGAIAPTQALGKITITLAVDSDQLTGLAKLRAARRLLARVGQACGAPGVRMQLDAETSRTMMTRRDPWVNMLRTTMAAAVAAMGGADSILVLPYTFALGQPDTFARRMARNTSLVLMEESGLGRVADPAAGSFAIETLTADLEQSAWQLFQDIEANGGLVEAVASGRWQAALAASADAKRKAIATGRVAITGTSAFPKLGDDGVVSPAPWPAPETRASKLNGATAPPLDVFRPAAAFEALREAADQYTKRAGKAPRVFLACLGPQAAHAGRATWIANFLAAGGIDVTQSEPISQSADAGLQFAASGAALACLCGADETYQEIGEASASAIKSAGAKQVMLAGRPKAGEAALRAAGVDGLIYAGADMIDALGALHRAIGVEATG